MTSPIPIATAKDVDTERLAAAIKEIADGLESGKLSVEKAEVCETADVSEPVVKETLSVTYSGEKDLVPIRPLEYTDD